MTTHQYAQPMLPWLLAGTLDDADLAAVEQHVAGCAQCQADLAWQRQLRAASAPPASGCDADRALAALLPRLGAQAPRVGMLARWRNAVAANDAWLRWAAGAQLAVIAALSLLLLRPAADTDYRALGAAPPSGSVVVTFRPDTPEREIRRILQANNARVVDGPTVTDAYVLALPATKTAAAIKRLRAEPAVTLAQPLTAGDHP
ncbi:zf-HC2 domain-containing protein [Massilia sp. R2A-15]|uniref:zf-HC2 domain-containing protein n=1 Tax=Massilia sp. R2A-15 TaxID=3064278 RepID=UPI0027353AB2|nr:zf-HC2 domain-containing protein [Massilia sp. R2A-15]WLI90599.1 zf-HC2 domain-containing protein [Massilia sp. R2A-15]